MAIDRMAPMLLNMAEGGTTWREHGITPDRVIERNGPHIELGAARRVGTCADHPGSHARPLSAAPLT